MNQCVPSWDLENNSSSPMLPNSSDLNLSDPFDVPVWEIAWENGQPSMHGFVKATPPRSLSSSPALKHSALSPQSAVDSEPIMDDEDLTAEDLVPWIDDLSQPQSLPMDAMVPCYLPPIGADKKKNVGIDTHSACGSVTFDGIGKGKTVIQTDASFHVSHSNGFSDYVNLDSIYPPPTIAPDDQKGNGGRPSASSKRRRVAAVHNLSERKRRDGINQRIKTLQSFVPNSTKTDKISVLDEVIEYVKKLKAEAQERDKPPPMRTPAVASQQHIPVPIVDPMGVGIGMGVGLGFVGINPIQQSVVPSLPPHRLNPSVVMPLQAWESTAGTTLFPSTPVACLQDPLSAYFKPQPISMDAYTRMIAFYSQLHHLSSSTPKN